MTVIHTILDTFVITGQVLTALVAIGLLYAALVAIGLLIERSSTNRRKRRDDALRALVHEAVREALVTDATRRVNGTADRVA